MSLMKLGVNEDVVWVNPHKITKVYLEETFEHDVKVWYAVVVFGDIENYEKFFISANDREVADVNMQAFIHSIQDFLFDE